MLEVYHRHSGGFAAHRPDMENRCVLTGKGKWDLQGWPSWVTGWKVASLP